MRNDGLAEAAILALAITIITLFLVVSARCAHEGWFQQLGDAMVGG